MVRKSAPILISEGVHTRPVDAHMFARTVEVLNHTPNAGAILTTSPFNLPVWKSYLKSHHDAEFTDRPEIDFSTT